MYKCVLQGKTVYQDAPCPETARQDTLQAPAPGPVKAAAGKDAAPPKDAETAALDSAIEVMAGYRACADGVADFEGGHRSAYEAWRLRNGGIVSRVENDGEARRKYTQALEALRKASPRTCANVSAAIKPGERKTNP